jgi:hypothetical protein
MIISFLKEADDDAATGESLNDDAKDSYQLLLYLWACYQGFTHPVTLTDPPASESSDAKAQEVLAQLDPRNAATKPAAGDPQLPTKPADWGELLYTH